MVLRAAVVNLNKVPVKFVMQNTTFPKMLI